MLAASPPLLSTVEGFNIDDDAFNVGGFPIQPPDPYGAVGRDHILNVGNLSIQWFTKSGVQQYHTSLNNFFAPLRPQPLQYSITTDPKVVYDQYTDRFVVIMLEVMDRAAFGHPTDMSRIMMAVSDNGDPNGTWYYYSINSTVNVPDPTGAGVPLRCWTDYPGLGLDKDAIYITGDLYEYGTGDGYGPRLWIVDKGLGKGGFYDNGPATVTLHDPAGLTGMDLTGNTNNVVGRRTMQPAHVFGTPPAGTGTWLVSYDGINNGVQEFVDVIRVDNPLTKPTFKRFPINLGDIEESTVAIDYNSPQRSSLARIDGGDRRVVNAVWRNNSLYATTVINPNSGPDINQVTAHWFRFDTSNALFLKLADQGNVGGEEIGFAAHTIWPAVNVDSQGNMVIGFSATGPTIYAGSYYAVRAPSDPAGTVRLAGTLADGLDVFALGGATPTSINRWGDYTSVALDPTDGVTFWLYNMYALPRQSTLAASGRWGTRWGSLRLADAPAPPPTGPVTIRGVVWHDQDESRRRETLEPGLSGWSVFVDLDGDGECDLGEPSVMTDSSGRYSFTLNVTGSVTIREALKPGWRQTYPGEPTLKHVINLSNGAPSGEYNFGNSDNDGFDHGDAPFPYPTLEANNGPMHAIRDGFGLGLLTGDGSTVVVDGEPDGLPDENALGDDNDKYPDDENGVIFTGQLVPGEPATVTITVSTGGRAAGYLQGWIDFNRDGDWADANEQVFTNMTLTAGVHFKTISVPVDAVPGKTFARFRYGYEKDLSYTGPSTAGEVEDYQVAIGGPVAVDDEFTIDSNSQDNIFTVLANDIPGVNGFSALQISAVNMTGATGTATIDNNGTSDFADDFIRYTPAPGVVGSVVFTYTVQDTGNLKTDTGTVSVTILSANRFRAVDDSYLVPPPAVDSKLLDVSSDPTLFNVLKNDIWGPSGRSPTIVAWNTAGMVGTVTLVSNIGGSGSQGFKYTSNGFVGTEQFTYTIVDLEGNLSTAKVTVQTGTTRTNDDLVRFRLETRDMEGNLITQIDQGMQFQVWAYVQDMRNVSGYQSVPGFPPQDQGVFSAYMDLLYDNAFVTYAGVEFSNWYSQGHFVNPQVPGIVDEIGAFQGTGSDNNFGNPYGASEKLLYKATFTATALGTARFKSDPADNLPLHETSLNTPETSVDYEQIDFRSTTINVVALPDLAKIRLDVTDLAGNSLAGKQVSPGTEFLVKAYVDDLGIRDDVPSFPANQEGVFSAYLDIVYPSTLARPVPKDPAADPVGFNFGITFDGLFLNGRTGQNLTGRVDEVGAFQDYYSLTYFSGEHLLFQIRFVALGGAGGTLVFTADPAEEPQSETNLIKLGWIPPPLTEDPGLTVPTARILYVNAPAVIVAAGSGEGEYTNPNNPYDVNNDGFVTPSDALRLVNFLNVNGTTDLLRGLAGGEGEGGAERMYYDVNADWIISPRDLLGVVNYMNQIAMPPAGAGEGEALGDLAFSLLPGESDSASGLPAGDLLKLPGAGNVPASASSTASWLPEKQAKVDDLVMAAVAREQDGIGSVSALVPALSDELADDIAAAWGQNTALDFLPADWA